MAVNLKDFFDSRVVRSIAADLSRVVPSFDEPKFTRSCLRGLDALELSGRGWQIAEAMRRALPSSFPRAARLLVQSLGPEHERSDQFGMAPFRYLPHVFYVAKYGQDDFEAAMTAQYELTKRFSAEYSIRTFLAKYPEPALERLRVWALDRNVHVRRLVSEGTRPRLPWAPRLRAFVEDPRPVLALLELLKDDPERYVQRSVANNLNDVSKDHPELALAVCKRWLAGASAGRRYIVQHALRTLVKAGHAGALDTLGFGGRPQVQVDGVKLTPHRVRLGDKLLFSFELTSRSKRPQVLLVDYRIHFVKANGGTRPKVFKLKKLELGPGCRAELGGRVSFQPMTTRKHYPGQHRLELVINGVSRGLGDFELVGR